MLELAPDQNSDTYCLFVCLLMNMIQIHSSNYYTDLMCSSCLGQQGPTTIRFLNHNYQIFLKKTNKAKNILNLFVYATHKSNKLVQISPYWKRATALLQSYDL